MFPHRFRSLVVHISITLFVLTGCTTPVPSVEQPDLQKPLIEATATIHQPNPSATPTTSPARTITAVTPTLTTTAGSPTPPPQAAYTPRVTIFSASGTLYQTVLSLPVSDEGFKYQGVGAQDFQVMGPSAFSALPDGSFAVADPVENRILRFSPTGELLNALGLRTLNIHMLSDMASVGGDILVLEAGFGPMPEVYRIYRFSMAGELHATYDLPQWARLETGLTGIGAGPAGEILLEMDGSGRVYLLIDREGNYASGPPVIQSEPGSIEWLKEGPTGIQKIKVFSQFTHGLGGLSILGASSDGSYYVVREDVVDDRVIRVDQTVHLIDPAGRQLGVARVPLDEYFYYVHSTLSIGPDGYVYALLPRTDTVDIIRLNLYSLLDPLVPSAIEPVVHTTLESPNH